MSVRVLSRLGLVLVLWFSSLSVAFAQSGVEVNSAVQHDVSPPLSGVNKSLPLAQMLSSSPAPLQNFDGVGSGFAGPQGTFTVNVAVPSGSGAVGATQYVQWVNTSFAVFDKTTGAVVYGPVPGNTLWAGFGGECEVTNDGDAIVQYDKAANRWVMTQLGGTGVAPFYQCVAVSTTSDATGSWYRYAFQQPYFNDYGKLGIWPDGYYMTYNMFNGGNTFVGARACAWDRASMLVGAPATEQCVQFLNSVDGLLPADMDGSVPPPAGSPNYVLTYTSNYLRLWKFHVDFANAANTSMTGPYVMAAEPFAEACGGTGACIPQLASSQLLNAVADRPMYRLAYRSFGDHESLVVNHSITAGTSVGIKWYELRDLSGYPTIYQQGTYSPDSNYRWMGSIAMDQAGNIALGYNVSGPTMRPSIAFTGRAPSDTLGVMAAETVVISGSGSQSANPRWGEYSSMNIDPVDDCTFWYTSEYLKTDGNFNWSTRIASFRLPGCGTEPTPDFVLSATPPSNTVTQGSGASYSVSVSPLQGFTGTVGLSVSGLPSGTGYSFNPASIAGSGASELSITTSSSTPPGTYALTVTGVSGSLTHSAPVTLVVNQALQDFTLTTTPSSRTIVQGASTTYTVSVSPVNGFAGNVALTVSGLPSGSTYTFSPSSITESGTSILTISTTTATPANLYPLTITGTSGSLSRSAAVTLAVTALPDFTLSAVPSTRNITRGDDTTYTVTVNPTGGFNGQVVFSVTGLPYATSATFTPSSVTGFGSSVLRIDSSRSTKPGTYTLTVTGTSGTLSRTRTLTLIVKQ
jgi:uncharacterized membrane protein